MDVVSLEFGGGEVVLEVVEDVVDVVGVVEVVGGSDVDVDVDVVDDVEEGVEEVIVDGVSEEEEIDTIT